MKDAEEKMTELTDAVHSLFRGYVNACYAHEDEAKKYKGMLKALKRLIEEEIEESGCESLISYVAGLTFTLDKIKEIENE